MDKTSIDEQKVKLTETYRENPLNKVLMTEYSKLLNDEIIIFYPAIQASTLPVYGTLMPLRICLRNKTDSDSFTPIMIAVQENNDQPEFLFMNNSQTCISTFPVRRKSPHHID